MATPEYLFDYDLPLSQTVAKVKELMPSFNAIIHGYEIENPESIAHMARDLRRYAITIGRTCPASGDALLWLSETILGIIRGESTDQLLARLEKFIW